MANSPFRSDIVAKQSKGISSVAHAFKPGILPTSSMASAQATAPSYSGGGGYSSRSTPTPSARINFAAPPPSMMQASTQPPVGRTMSDVDALNKQLENAIMMQKLGYDATFDDGTITYSKAEEEPYYPETQEKTYQYSQYGAYGESPSPLMYESDYMMAQEAAYRQEQYTPRNDWGYQGYNRNYYRKPYNRYYNGGYRNYNNQNYNQNGYYNRYYSNYGQRYYGNNYNNSRRQYNEWSDGYANFNNSRERSR